MTDVRDNGMAALERGDNGAAVTLLSASCRLDPDDFASHLGLGQALLRLERADDAVTPLERAVALAPPSADARRELGLALAAAGRTPEAMRALLAALTLKPNDRAAQQALDRVRQQASPPPQIAPPVHRAIRRQLSADRSTPADIPSPPNREAPFSRTLSQPLPLLAPDAQRVEPVQSLSGEMSAASMPGSPTGHEPTIAVMAPPVGDRFAEPTVPNYGLPVGDPMAGRGPYWTGPVKPAVKGYDDEFSVADAYYGLPEVLASPRNFFAAQTDYEGNGAPLSMLAAYTINLSLGLLLVLLTAGAQLGPVGMVLLLLLPFGLVLLYAALTIVMAGAAAMLHACAAVFGSRASFSGSFRAVVFASAPVFTAAALALALSTVRPHGPTSALLLTVLPYMLGVVALWSVLLLGMALRYIHRFSLEIVILMFILLVAIGAGFGYAVNLLSGLV